MFKTRSIFFILLILNVFNSIGQIPGNAIFLDGVNDFISVPSNSSLAIADNLTLETWVNACNSSGDIMGKNLCSGNEGFHLSITNGKLVYVWMNLPDCGTFNSYSSDNAVMNLNTWIHIALVHTSAAISLYVNGNLVPGSLTAGSYSTINQNSHPLLLGVYQGVSGNYGNYFKGQLDEIRIWNIALSPSEIQSRYNHALAGTEAGLVAYYNFEGINSTGQNSSVPNQATSTGSINNGLSTGTSITPFFNNVDASSCLPPQFITFNSISNKSCDDSSFALNNSISSGLPISYTVISGPASISGNVLTLSGNPGPITVKASQAGNSSFAPAPDVFQTFVVSCSLSVQTDLPIIIYELVTSNDDGNNDYFYIENIESYPDNEVSVFNQWGNIIFHSKAYKNDWNGRNLADGTYFYTVTIHSPDKTYKGGFLLSH